MILKSSTWTIPTFSGSPAGSHWDNFSLVEVQNPASSSGAGKQNRLLDANNAGKNEIIMELNELIIITRE